MAELHLSAKITDDERVEKWRLLSSDYDGTNSDLIRELIDDEFDERDDLTLDADPDELGGDDDVPEIVEEYDPDDFGRMLTREEVEALLDHVDDPRFAREHVHRSRCKQGRHVDVVAAVARYENLSGKSDIREVCVDLGWDTDHFTRARQGDVDVPGKVMKKFGGEGKETETIDTSGDDADYRESVTEAVEAAVYWDDDGDRTYLHWNEAMESWERVSDGAVEDGLIGEKAAEVVGRALKNKSGEYATDDELERAETVSEVVDWYVDDSPAVVKWTDDERMYAMWELASVVVDLIDDDVDLSGVDPVIRFESGGVTDIQSVSDWLDSLDNFVAGDVPTPALEKKVERGEMLESAAESIGDDEAVSEVRTRLEDLREQLDG